MVKTIVFLFLIFTTSFFQKDPCEVFGSICLVKSQYNADLIVYVENEDNIADLSVFIEDSKLMADQEGVWYFTEAENFADYRIFISKDRRIADFTIQYIDERAFAGCQ